MATPEENRIYRLSALCGLLAAASFVVPRFVASPEGGLAAGTSAVMVFFAMLLATAIFSLYPLAVTVRCYKHISPAARVAGLAPSCILAIALLSLLLILAY